MSKEYDVPALARLPVEVLLLIAQHGGSFARTLVPLSAVSMACRLSIVPVSYPRLVMKCDLQQLALASPIFKGGVQHLSIHSPTVDPTSIQKLPKLPSLLTIRISGVAWVKFRHLMRLVLSCSPQLNVVAARFASDWVIADGSDRLINEPWYHQGRDGDIEASRPETFILSCQINAQSLTFGCSAWAALMTSISLLHSVRRLCLDLRSSNLRMGARAGNEPHPPHCESLDDSVVRRACPLYLLVKALSSLENVEGICISGAGLYSRNTHGTCLLEHLCLEKFPKLVSLRGPFAQSSFELELIGVHLNRKSQAGLRKLRQLSFTMPEETIRDVFEAVQVHPSWPDPPEWAEFIFTKLPELEEISLVTAEPDVRFGTSWWTTSQSGAEKGLQLVLKPPLLFPAFFPTLIEGSGLDSAASRLC